MKLWYVELRTAYLDGDSLESRIIEAETAGNALDRHIQLLRTDRAGGLIGWSCCSLREITKSFDN